MWKNPGPKEKYMNQEGFHYEGEQVGCPRYET